MRDFKLRCYCWLQDNAQPNPFLDFIIFRAHVWLDNRLDERDKYLLQYDIRFRR
jgi:hypothetical protein